MFKTDEERLLPIKLKRRMNIDWTKKQSSNNINKPRWIEISTHAAPPSSHCRSIRTASLSVCGMQYARLSI